jgi:hypothetical protein
LDCPGGQHVYAKEDNYRCHQDFLDHFASIRDFILLGNDKSMAILKSRELCGFKPGVSGTMPARYRDSRNPPHPAAGIIVPAAQKSEL